jgi:hypothetical protein
MLLKVLALLGEPMPVGSLAALRYWGQAGERSTGWIAGADPIHLEPRLHSLRMRCLRADELPKTELRPLFEHLQSTLGDDSGLAFSRLGYCGYVSGDSAIATASMSASLLHGLPPDEFIPSGESAAGYHRLLGEIQMVLHEHEVNRRRVETGRPAINSLWLWGGGIAPAATNRELPILVANDPLFRGYWNSCAGVVADWETDLASSGKNLSSGFVAVMPELAPEASPGALMGYVEQLRNALARGDVGSLTLLFRDGLSADISRWQALRFWRRVPPSLKKKNDDD